MKKLSKEYIESFEFNSHIQYYGQAEICVLYPNVYIGGLNKEHLTYYITYFFDNNNLSIRMYNKENKEETLLKDGFTPIFIFNGIIKKESEFKKLLQQLRII